MGLLSRPRISHKSLKKAAAFFAKDSDPTR